MFNPLSLSNSDIYFTRIGNPIPAINNTGKSLTLLGTRCLLLSTGYKLANKQNRKHNLSSFCIFEIDLLFLVFSGVSSISGLASTSCFFELKSDFTHTIKVETRSL